MALGLKCSRMVHPAFRNYLAASIRPVSEVTLKTVHERQHGHRQCVAYSAVPVHHFATKKAKAKGKGKSQTRVNISAALVEDIINLEEVNEEMKSVIEAQKDNFNKTLNIRTSPGSLDKIAVVIADGKLALNQISQISMKSPQLILVNMASSPESGRGANSGTHSPRNQRAQRNAGETGQTEHQQGQILFTEGLHQRSEQGEEIQGYSLRGHH
ncbi:ribosome-recycling factor, mitochondrial-like isoform X3 [Symphalangus syndactylus]|uniref:ribosome-recycling factor, mitochondrial-like isoform X3 n=1 Tax=Symphalangus syndactylus TaxID=9590 RepID=UPI0024430D3A|nr:ribosome-recycling factor, mitochondrial-like isoform X2 [Symphalangus syndactylus]